jgi:hypothetical protein
MSQGISIAEFVVQEAKEKCFEIDVLALKDFEAKKEEIL